MSIIRPAVAAIPIIVFFIVLPSESAEPVVVTATRTAETADATLAPVTVITREDIERSPHLSVRELLLGTAGIDATENGAYGKTTGLFVRGTNTDQVLTLVDGVKLYSATLGTTAFQHIPLDQIERIEIVRGPRSSLYGSEAIGGVIQIFTRKGQAETVGNGMLGGGSDSTYEGGAGVSGAAGSATYSIQASALDTKGINITDFQPDRDGYDNQSFSGSIKHPVGETGELGFQILRAQGSTKFDNLFDPNSFTHDADFVQQVANLRADLSPTESWFMRLQGGQSRDDTENFTNDEFFSDFDTTRDEVSWQNDLQLGAANLVTLGVDYSNDRVDGSVDYTVDSRDNVGLFGQIQSEFERSRLVAGVRNDDNEQFGSETTGSIDYGYDLTAGLRLSGGLGTGFKAPSFNQLFFPDFGNPDLDPEQSRSAEIALTGSSHSGRWAARLFHTEIDDLIVIDLVEFAPENVEEAQISGLELEYFARNGPWNWSAVGTFIDPENKATGKQLRRRARETVKLTAGRQFGKWQFNFSILAQGKRYEDADNAIELDGYERVDATVIYPLGARLNLGLYVQNVFDEEYETSEGFRQKGLTAMLRLRYRTD